MAETVTLEAAPRTTAGKKNRALRRNGFVPLNLYGHGVASVPLEADEKILHQALRHTTASSLIKLTVDGKNHNVMVRNVQRHPVTGRLMHLDFYQVRMDEKTHLRLPLAFVGEAPAVKLHDGIMVHLVDGLNVEGLPGDFPHNLEVDVSGLTDLDQAIHVKDIQISSKLRILDDPEELVAKIQPPKVTAEEVEAAAEEAAEEAKAPAEEPAPPAAQASE